MSQLNVRLDEIQRRFDAAQEPGQRGRLRGHPERLVPRGQAACWTALPEDVDGKLRDATEESFARLQQLVDDGCQDIEPTETETTPTETTPPETVPPETTPPETTPPETTAARDHPGARPRRTTTAAAAAPTRTAPAAGAPQAPEGDG